MKKQKAKTHKAKPSLVPAIPENQDSLALMEKVRTLLVEADTVMKVKEVRNLSLLVEDFAKRSARLRQVPDELESLARFFLPHFTTLAPESAYEVLTAFERVATKARELAQELEARYKTSEEAGGETPHRTDPKAPTKVVLVPEVVDKLPSEERE